MNYLLLSTIAIDDFYESIGVYLEERTELLFHENNLDIYLSRHYGSPCDNLDRKRFIGLDFCATKGGRRNFDESFNKLEETCTRMWEDAVRNLTKLTMTQPHSVPELRAQAAMLNKHRNKRTPNVGSMDDEMTQRHETPIAREPRSVSAVITGIGILSSLVSSLTTGISGIYHFFQSRKQNQKLYLKTKNSMLSAAEIATNNVHDLKAISVALCDENFHTNLLLAEMYTNMLLRDSVRTIENEILSYNFGTIPKTSSFLSTLLDLCTSIEPNNERFCKHLIFSGGVDLEFNGLAIKNGFLVSLIKINIPIQSVLFMKNMHLEVINLGSYNQQKYFQIQLPQDVIVTDDTFYSLNRGLCNGIVCDINSVMVQETARCLRSIVSNRTQFCTSVFMTPPRDCSFRKVTQGTLIRAAAGVFFPTGQTPFGAVSLNKRAMFTSSQGRLLCQNSGGYNTTHILTPGHILIKNSTSVLEPRVKINRNFDFNKTNIMLSETLELARKIKDLYSIDDTININGTEQSIFLTMVIISTIISISGLTLYVTFHYRKLLYNFTISTISTLRGLKNKTGKEAMELGDNENQEELGLTLINESQKTTIYPKLRIENENEE